MSITVVEPQCIGFEHAPFNAGMLAVLRSALPSERFQVFAESVHLSHLQAHLPESTWDSLEVHALFPPCRSQSDLSLKRLPDERALFSELFRNANGQGASHLMLLSITAAGILAVKEELERYPHIQVYAVLHGILSTLPIKSLSLKKLFTNAFRPIFLMPPHERLHYIVPGQSIKDNLTSGALNYLSPQIHAIDHPFIYPDLSPSSPKQQGELKFCTFGAIHRSKGSHHFFDLAAQQHQAIAEQRASFHVVGHVADDKLKARLNEGYIIAPEQAHAMDRSTFAALAEAMDYAVFYYAPEDYALRASGALFDAFAYAKPIISLRNPFFEMYFERFGDIGYLCESVEEVNATVARCIDHLDPERYAQQQRNLLHLRKSLAPECLAKDMVALFQQTVNA